MTKKEQREFIFNKYNGRCAYCGCKLEKGWHVDELKSVRRKYKYADAYWKEGKNKYTWQEVNRMKLSEEEMTSRGFKWIEKKLVFNGYEHPENLHIDNQMPSCASCNINKHSDDLESFRKLIEGFINSLNRDSTQYKIAKRYGLIKETVKPVVFYFEMLNNKNAKK